jgi:maleylacetoacetate isomerase
MKLYGYWRSSSAWRVRIALELKGIPYDNVPVHLLRGGGAQKRPEFVAMNAMAQVPVLEVDEPGGPVFVTQSMAIIEYLDERQPEPPLLPLELLLRARARELAEIVNSGIQPLQNTAVQAAVREIAPHADARAWSRAFVEKGMFALERAAIPSAKSFLLGDRPLLPDLYLVPQLYQARRLGVDVARYPTLLRVERACERLAEFQRAHAERQPDAEPAPP